MKNEGSCFRPKPVDHLVLQSLDDEVLIYDTKNNKAHCLNSGMRAVWELCNGKNNLTNILENLKTKNDSGLTIHYVQLAVKELLHEHLLEVDSSSSILKEISRRDVIRKLGTGALMALPVIASVAIPTPAEAASCFSLGHLCSRNSQCCSGHCGVAGISLVCLP